MWWFVFLCLSEELWNWNSLKSMLACGAAMTVISSLTAFEQKLVSEYPLYDRSQKDFYTIYSVNKLWSGCLLVILLWLQTHRIAYFRESWQLVVRDCYFDLNSLQECFFIFATPYSVCRCILSSVFHHLIPLPICFMPKRFPAAPPFVYYPSV